MPTIVASTKIMVLNVVAIISNLVPKTDFDFFQSDSVPRLAGRWYQSFSRCWSEKDLLRREAVREGETRFQKFQSKANFSDEESRVQTHRSIGIDKSIL